MHLHELTRNEPIRNNIAEYGIPTGWQNQIFFPAYA